MLGSRQLRVVRRVAGLAGLVFFSLPAFPQSKFLSAEPTYSVGQPTVAAAIPPQPSFISAAPSGSFLPDHPIALQASQEAPKSQRGVVQWASLGASRSTVAGGGIIVRMVASFEEVETPFLDHVRVPLVSVLGGRVQLSGFQSVTSMANFLWGLPLKTSASGGTLVQQSHPGIRVPGNNQSYGLSLRFRFSKQDGDRTGNGLWSTAHHAVSWGRTFLTL